jgi:hypothetical protein
MICFSCFSFVPFTSYQCLSAVFFCLFVIYLRKFLVDIVTFYGCVTIDGVWIGEWIY